MEPEKRNETCNDQHCDSEPKAVVIDANDLFDGRREICLELDGVRYRLRITRRNKLILQK